MSNITKSISNIHHHIIDGLKVVRTCMVCVWLEKQMPHTIVQYLILSICLVVILFNVNES